MNISGLKGLTDRRGEGHMHHLKLMHRRTGHRTEYGCRPRLASEARDAVSQFFSGLRPPASPRTEQNVLLLVSELVTNAIRHAGGVLSLRLTADPWTLRVVVEDLSPDVPSNRVPDMTGRTGGFGWPMVLSLAEAVTVLPRPDGGKAVVATMPR
jgi:anti-sigma regulatory factor (Ser/Thr protein kinase)